jgi:hypothetical protein
MTAVQMEQYRPARRNKLRPVAAAPRTTAELEADLRARHRRCDLTATLAQLPERPPCRYCGSEPAMPRWKCCEACWRERVIVPQPAVKPGVEPVRLVLELSCDDDTDERSAAA